MRKYDNSSSSDRKAKKKILPKIINPEELESNGIILLSHLYDSAVKSNANDKKPDRVEVAAQGKIFKKLYWVTYPARYNNNNDEQDNSMIVQPVMLTHDIIVSSMVVIDPEKLEFPIIDYLAYVHTLHPGINPFLASQPYLAVKPDEEILGNFLYQPFMLISDIYIHDLIEIKVTELTNITAALLKILLDTHPDETFFISMFINAQSPKKYIIPVPDPTMTYTRCFQIVGLSSSIIRFERKKRYDTFSSCDLNEYRYAVMRNDVLGDGSEAEGYISDASIKFKLTDDDEEIVHKSKLPHKWRFIKLLRPRRDDAGKLKRNSDGKLYDCESQNKKATREWDFLKEISFFSVKNPVKTKDDHCAALIMRHFPGKPLFELFYLDQLLGKFTVAQGIKLTLLVGEELLSIHLQGIIHRDISLNNILVQVDNHRNPDAVKIIDYGMAKWDFENNVREVWGTREYRAPEESTTVKSDSYSYAKIFEEFWGSLFQSSKCQSLKNADQSLVMRILSRGIDHNIANRASVSDIVMVFSKLAEYYPIDVNSLRSPHK